MFVKPLSLLFAPLVLAAPLLAEWDAAEADLPKVGCALDALRGLARRAADEQAALHEAQPLLLPLNRREITLLALLLPELAAGERSEQARRALHALAERAKARAQEDAFYRDRWPGGECSPTPLDMPRVLAVTGRIATIARNAQRAAERRPGGYGGWSWDAPRRVAAREEMRSLIKGLDAPKDIFAVAVMLAEYQEDSGGNVEDWLLYQDAELMPAMRLGELGTPEAFLYFGKLRALYGRDGGGSLIYREMEGEFFGGE